MVLTDFVESSAAAWISSGGGGVGNGGSIVDYVNHTNLSMITPSSVLLASTQAAALSTTPMPGGDPEISETTFIIVSTVVPVFFGFIGITGLLGNALVVLVVLSNQNMRSTTNLLIINLAMADLLFVIFCVPFTGSDYVLDEWPYGDVWCRIVQYLIVVTAHASIYTLVLMSLDRYLAVVHPIASMVIRTETYTMRAIFVLWFIILTTAIPVLYIHGENVSRRLFWGSLFSAWNAVDWWLVGWLNDNYYYYLTVTHHCGSKEWKCIMCK